MFDIGFAELVLVLVVGLLVLGPERLPAAVRTTALWIGRLKRNFNQIRSDLERELGADEIRQQIHNETIMQSLKDSKQEMEKLKQDLLTVKDDLQQEDDRLKQIEAGAKNPDPAHKSGTDDSA